MDQFKSQIEFFKAFDIEAEEAGCIEFKLKEECIGDCIDCTHYDSDQYYPDLNAKKFLDLISVYNEHCHIGDYLFPEILAKMKEDEILTKLRDKSSIVNWEEYKQKIRKQF